MRVALDKVKEKVHFLNQLLSEVAATLAEKTLPKLI